MIETPRREVKDTIRAMFATAAVVSGYTIAELELIARASDRLGEAAVLELQKRADPWGPYGRRIPR